jgi:hypothetical protein
VSAEAWEQRTKDAGAGLGVDERAVRALGLEADRGGHVAQPPPAHQRSEAPRHRHRAEHRRRRPRKSGAIKRLLEHAHVERGAVGDEHPAGEKRGDVGQDFLRRRSAVGHGLADPGEALDAPRQRSDRSHQRVEALVQLAAADQYGAHLSQLAIVAAPAVGLDVDRHELGLDERAPGGGGGGAGHGHGRGTVGPVADGVGGDLQPPPGRAGRSRPVR